VIEPVKPKRSLREILATFEPIDEEFPDVDASLRPLDDIKL
jgi:antitoxin VapB